MPTATKKCSCDACKASTTGRYCAFCEERCFPQCMIDGRKARAKMAPATRQALHAELENKASKGAGQAILGKAAVTRITALRDELVEKTGNALERAVRENAGPILEQAARAALRKIAGR